MPKVANYTKFYSVYTGTPFSADYSGELVMDCPLFNCDNPSKHFYGNTATGQWHCKRCDQKGNARQLITMLHDQYFNETTDKQYLSLERTRHIDRDMFKAAKWAYDYTHDRWLVPYYTWDVDTNKYSLWLNNLGYFYPSAVDPKGRYVVHKAPVLPLYLYNPGIVENPSLYDEVDITEGEWDCLAWYMVCDTYILGKPGAGFNAAFMKTLKDISRVNFLLDNDPGGRKQTANAIAVMREQKSTQSVFVIDWSLVEYAKKDIRDLVPHHRDTMVEDVTKALVPHSASLSEVPSDEDEPQVPEKLTAGYVRDATQFPMIKSFNEYIASVRDMLYLNESTVMAMAATFAVTTSITIPGEPIWLFLIGPPGSGKTTLIESFGGTNQWFDNLSKISAEAFVSGYRDDSGQEASYLPTLQNKTLFVKDFTTTLTGKKDDMIKVFGLLTDIYDGHVKIHYGNNLTKEFHDTYFNMVAGVTDIILTHSAASIGERFLRLDWLGRDYDRREYTRRAVANFGLTDEQKRRMTMYSLGFVRYLRERDISLSIPDAFIDPIVDLAEFVAILRTKVEQDRYEGLLYKPRPELGTRLGKQFCKLFSAARVVLNSDMAAFKMICKIAMDTCYGFPLDIVNFLVSNPYATREEIVDGTGIHAQRTYRVLNDLLTTGVLYDGSAKLGGRRSAGRPAINYQINPQLLPALKPSMIDDAKPKHTAIVQRPRPVISRGSVRPRLPQPIRRPS